VVELLGPPAIVWDELGKPEAAIMALNRKGKVDPKQQQEAASALAVTALSFIASEPERLGRFLATTGIGPESIRDAAQEPDFLLGVLDYLMGDEELLLAFANENSFDPAHVASAREILAGPPVTD
jgi:hypothetical protein